MKKALFLLIVMLSAVVLSEFVMLSVAEAQKHSQQKIDSLLTVLKTAKEDTTKVKTLNVLASEFGKNNPDTAIYFAKEELALATKLNYKIGIAKANIIMGNVLLRLGNFEKAMKNLNNALTLIDELLTSAATSNKSYILKGKATVYNSIGNVLSDQEKYPEALKNYFTSLQISQEIGDKQGINNANNNIGGVYLRTANYPEALKYYLISLKLKEEIGDKDLAASYHNIGMIYEEQGNYPEALKNYSAALKLNEEFGNKDWEIRNLKVIGDTYLEQGNYSEALKNFSASLKIADEVKSKEGMFYAYLGIGDVYNKQGNFTESLKNYFTGLKIIKEIGYKVLIAECCIAIGEDYIKLKNTTEASRYLDKGLLLAKESRSLPDIEDSYMRLATLDSLQGNFKQAFVNYKMFITYRDSAVNRKNAEKTMQIQMQYDFDKKESLAKAEQEKKDVIALKEMQRQKLLRNALIGGFAFLLILGVIIFIIMIQYREIRAIKKERNRISGELHDDIGADLNRITMVSQLLQKKTNKDKEMQEQLGIISEAGKMVLGSIGEIIWTMNPQQDNLEGLVAHIRRFVTEYLEMNRIEVGFAIPDDIPERPVSDKYRRNIFLAIKEAIYNITKYSKATRVQLSMNLEKRMAGIEIHDNGTGFSVINKQNWGNGLRNMNQRMKDIGGNFLISSGKDQGTLIRFNFPVH